MGQPQLHALRIAFTRDGGATPTHELQVRVGLREIRGALDARQNWVLTVNGRRLLVRGAGWSPDLLQRMSSARNELEVSLARHAGLNAVRFEGKLQDDDIFDQLDAAGLLALPGLSCCDAWQAWGTWDAKSARIATASVDDQMRRLRRHPSLMAFMLASDEVPPPHIEQMYTRVAQQRRLSVPLLAAASWRNSSLSGLTGVKMSGPYAWVPPNFWSDPAARSEKAGGAWGFLTEASPGSSPLTLPSELASSDAARHGWPLNFSEMHTAGGHVLGTPALRRFREAANARYGGVHSVEAWESVAQLAALESHKAMFEAYSQAKYEATGIVQWMLNNAWPSNTWHLYDTRLAAGGAFYGVRTACAPPLAIQRHGTSGAILVVNSRYVPFTRVRVSVEVFTLDGQLVRVANATLPHVAADSVSTVFAAMPLPSEPSLLRLRLVADGAPHSSELASSLPTHRNDYLLPPSADVINFTAGCGNGGCASVSYANMSSVTTLPFVPLTHSATVDTPAGARAPMSARVTVMVSSPAAANAVVLGVHLRLLATDPHTLRTADVLPVLWDDDYFALVPGESRTILGTFNPLTVDSTGAPPVLVVESLNAALHGLAHA